VGSVIGVKLREDALDMAFDRILHDLQLIGDQLGAG
jgi:hypothetical protein